MKCRQCNYRFQLWLFPRYLYPQAKSTISYRNYKKTNARKSLSIFIDYWFICSVKMWSAKWDYFSDEFNLQDESWTLDRVWNTSRVFGPLPSHWQDGNSECVSGFTVMSVLQRLAASRTPSVTLSTARSSRGVVPMIYGEAVQFFFVQLNVCFIADKSNAGWRVEHSAMSSSVSPLQP